MANLPFVSKATLRSFPQSRLRWGDVLIVRTGAKAGEVAMFGEPEGEYYASSHTLVLRAGADVNPRYLEQFLVSRLGKEQILRHLTGAAQRQLQKPSVASIWIPLPPRAIQDAIGDRINATYRCKRELHAKAETLQESIDRFVLAKLGTDWGRPPDRGKPAGREAVWFDTWRHDVKRLDPKHYRYQREGPTPRGLRRLGDLLTRRREKVDRAKYAFADLQLISLHFDGTMSARDVKPWRKDVKGTLWFAYPGDLVYSKIDARNGAIGLVPDDFARVAVTSEYPVYRVKQGISAEYLKIVLRTLQFTDLLKAMAAGHSGRKRVQPSELEDILIPAPSLAVQREIANEVHRRRERAEGLCEEAKRVLADAKAEVERMILGEEEV